jgi:hypothetical protein
MKYFIFFTFCLKPIKYKIELNALLNILFSKLKKATPHLSVVSNLPDGIIDYSNILGPSFILSNSWP